MGRGWVLVLEQGSRRAEWRLYEPLRWSRYDYQIVKNPIPGLLTVFRLQGQSWPAEGIFLPRGWTPDDWPDPRDSYEPLQKVDRILGDIQRMGNPNDKAVLAFVNRWGLLGVGLDRQRILRLSDTKLALAEVRKEPQIDGVLAALQRLGRPSIALFDGVRDTCDWLRWIIQITERIKTLKTGRGHSWETVAGELNGVACNITLSLRLGSAGLELAYSTPTLLHVLTLRLVEWVTGAQNLRQCGNPKCDAIFRAGDARQKFCGKSCTRQAGVDRFRARRRS